MDRMGYLALAYETSAVFQFGGDGHSMTRDYHREDIRLAIRDRREQKNGRGERPEEPLGSSQEVIANA